MSCAIWRTADTTTYVEEWFRECTTELSGRYSRELECLGHFQIWDCLYPFHCQLRTEKDLHSVLKRSGFVQSGRSVVNRSENRHMLVSIA